MKWLHFFQLSYATGFNHELIDYADKPLAGQLDFDRIQYTTGEGEYIYMEKCK